MIKKLIEKVYGKFCQCNDEIKTEETMIKKIWKKIKDIASRVKGYFWTRF